jgi:hypothetical protein
MVSFLVEAQTIRSCWQHKDPKDQVAVHVLFFQTPFAAKLELYHDDRTAEHLAPFVPARYGAGYIEGIPINLSQNSLHFGSNHYP